MSKSITEPLGVKKDNYKSSLPPYVMQSGLQEVRKAEDHIGLKERQLHYTIKPRWLSLLKKMA